ncbi:glycosyltransferase family 4 protein [Dehalococcoidia bacterium]|nr:glycosyltransferase family 4 protein [Dehalococcoidia bacterium]
MDNKIGATKFLIVSNTDWNMYNFRLPLATMLRNNGFEVVIVCPPGKYISKLEEAGFRVLQWDLRRRSLSLWNEIRAFVQLAQIYNREAPDVVHHFTIKPNIYGTIAARLAHVHRIINTWTGLGFIFSPVLLARWLRWFLVPLMGRTFRSSNVWSLVQNKDDLQYLIRLGLVNSDQTTLIPSSGVDTSKFSPRAGAHSHPPIVFMASRLLWDKGVAELVQAARLLIDTGLKAEFWIAGSPDTGNPASIPQETVANWEKTGIVKFLGHRDDIPTLLRRSDIAVLPSYHEGVPRFLLEAAATGLPMVATDIEGCRMVIQNGINGFLVPPKDTNTLANALARLIEDENLRICLGKESRRIATEKFGEELIMGKYMAFYNHIGILDNDI